MMWAMMGIGMLFNAIQGAGQRNQMNEMMQAQQAENAKMMKSMQSQQAAMQETSFTNMLQIQTGLPEYPEENFNNLQEMQMGHLDARQAFTDQLSNDLQSAKTAFFETNHYDTKLGADGRHEVAQNEEGKPNVKDGKENGDQKLARMTFEGQKKAELTDKHTAQKETFISKERENFKEFLAMNRDQLQNPAIQGELQRLVVNTKKKSLELQQNQEDERWRVDMPPSEEIAMRLDTGLKQLRQLDQKHLQAEEDSPDAKALAEHDQQVAAILYDKRRDAQQEKNNDNEFMMDPRKMMAVAQQRRQPKDVGEALPSYLTNAMYELGVYTV